MTRKQQFEPSPSAHLTKGNKSPHEFADEMLQRVSLKSTPHRIIQYMVNRTLPEFGLDFIQKSTTSNRIETVRNPKSHDRVKFKLTNPKAIAIFGKYGAKMLTHLPEAVANSLSPLDIQRLCVMGGAAIGACLGAAQHDVGLGVEALDYGLATIAGGVTVGGTAAALSLFIRDKYMKSPNHAYAQRIATKPEDYIRPDGTRYVNQS
jgi:hypothetical protein